MQLPLSLLLLLPLAPVWAASSSSSASTTRSAAASSGSLSPSTVSSAALPSLSGVPACITNCLAVAASAAGCDSEAAVNCFCVTPQNYTTAFVSCLTACPDQVASAEALVEQFCAAASTPTSLSFPSFTPSSTSASRSVSHSGSSLASSTAPASSSSSTSATATPTGGAAAADPRTALVAGVLGLLLAALVGQ